jgi:hypothetical protein
MQQVSKISNFCHTHRRPSQCGQIGRTICVNRALLHRNEAIYLLVPFLSLDDSFCPSPLRASGRARLGEARGAASRKSLALITTLRNQTLMFQARGRGVKGTGNISPVFLCAWYIKRFKVPPCRLRGSGVRCMHAPTMAHWR